MNAVAVVAAVLAGVTILGAAVKAWPAVWTLFLLPGQITGQLSKLDQLDAVKLAAEEARDEWQGATAAVNRLAGDHEDRIKALAGRVSSLEQWRTRTEDRAP